MPQTVARNSCNQYTLANTDVATVTYNINKLNDSKVFVLQSSGTIAQDNQVIYQFGNDGVYEVEFVGLDKYTIIMYCDIQNGMFDMIKQINCNCSVCKDEIKYAKLLYYFNSLTLLFYTFLASINKQYVDNWIYSALDPHDFEDLYCISTMITRMNAIITCAGYLDPLCDCDKIC